MRLNAWFFREESNVILSGFRAIICLYLLLFHSTPSDYNLYGTSGEFTPAGIFNFLPQVDGYSTLLILSAIFRVSLFLGVLGFLTGPALLAALIAGTYVLAYHFNFGDVGHGITLIYTCLLVLTLVPWSTWKTNYIGVHARWPMAFLKCFIVASYFIAGIQKLRFSGMDWAWSENLAIYVFQNSSTFAGQILLELPPIVLRSLAVGALGIELLSPLALLSRRSGYIFVVLWVSLHVGVQVAMGHHKSFLSQIPCLLVFCEGFLLFAGKYAGLIRERLIELRNF